jgi:multidrug resistance efflux pump
MTDAKRTFQITLPTFQWKSFCTWKTVWFVLTLCTGALGFYWWTEVRPFISVPGGTLRVAMREVFAEQEGVASEFFGEDMFQQGQVLFSTKDPLLLTQQQILEQKMADRKKELETLQGKFDQNMEQYVYLQNELETKIGPTELTDQIFAEIQKLQDRIQRLEQETQGLEASRLSMADKLDSQVVLAPFEGVVLHRLKQAGERVARGDCLLKICELEHRWIETEIEEKMLSDVRIGLPAHIEFLAFPGKQWKGQVSWISPVVETGKVKIRVTADSLPLRPGLSAQTYIKIY